MFDAPNPRSTRAEAKTARKQNSSKWSEAKPIPIPVPSATDPSEGPIRLAQCDQQDQPLCPMLRRPSPPPVAPPAWGQTPKPPALGPPPPDLASVSRGTPPQPLAAPGPSPSPRRSNVPLVGASPTPIVLPDPNHAVPRRTPSHPAGGKSSPSPHLAPVQGPHSKPSPRSLHANLCPGQNQTPARRCLEIQMHSRRWRRREPEIPRSVGSQYWKNQRVANSSDCRTVRPSWVI